MASHHVQEFLSCCLKLEHAAWWVVAQHMATQGASLRLIEGCPQVHTVPYTKVKGQGLLA